MLKSQTLIAAALLSRPPCKAALELSSLGRELPHKGAAAGMLSCCASLQRPRVLRSMRVNSPL